MKMMVLDICKEPIFTMGLFQTINPFLYPRISKHIKNELKEDDIIYGTVRSCG